MVAILSYTDVLWMCVCLHPHDYSYVICKLSGVGGVGVRCTVAIEPELSRAASCWPKALYGIDDLTCQLGPLLLINIIPLGYVSSLSVNSIG